VGVFRYSIEIGASMEGPFETIEAVVDTGAFYTWVPASVLERLGLRPAEQRQFKIAEGRVIERGVAEVVVRIEGRALHTQCVFGDEGSEPLLGAFTLEGFALVPDPVGERLTPLETLPLLFAGDLATKRCVPCEGGAKPMSSSEAEAYLAQVPGWELVSGEPLKIARALRFKDFLGAMAFVNRVAGVAEAEGHHPDICVSWNRVRLELLTHAIGGLSENDFIMAAKINELEARG
jgi:4a-hydroxytetrahydrobiopterin dehydratase